MYIFCVVAFIYSVYWLLNTIFFNKNIIPYFINNFLWGNDHKLD
jgi:hypothetical protein